MEPFSQYVTCSMCSVVLSRYFLWLFELNSRTLVLVQSLKAPWCTRQIKRTGYIYKHFLVVSVFVFLLGAFFSLCLSLHAFVWYSRVTKTEPSDYRSQAKWNKSCNNINNNDDVMLYICRLFAYNVNVKYRWIVAGFALSPSASSSSPPPPPLPSFASVILSFCSRTHSLKMMRMAKQQQQQQQKKRPTSQNEQQANAENEQNQANSKHFNVNWSNYISELIHSTPPEVNSASRWRLTTHTRFKISQCKCILCYKYECYYHWYMAVWSLYVGFFSVGWLAGWYWHLTFPFFVAIDRQKSPKCWCISYLRKQFHA